MSTMELHDEMKYPQRVEVQCLMSTMQLHDEVEYPQRAEVQCLQCNCMMR